MVPVLQVGLVVACVNMIAVTLDFLDIDRNIIEIIYKFDISTACRTL